MKKLLGILLAFALTMSLFAGCGSKQEDTATTDTSVNESETVDTVATASLVEDGDALTKALSADGNWIIAILNDVTLDKEIVVDGEFHNKADDTKDIYRKLALYAQDDEHNITAQYKLTAPKMTVKSENFNIQGGTFVGDVYVEANGFTVGKSATVEGNIYFATQENKDSFVVVDTAKVTGSMEVAAANVDAVTTASIVDNADALIKALDADGNWIAAILNDVATDKEIVVDGEFHNKADSTKDIYRKLALYAQDDEHNITAQYKLTAPKITVKSENFNIQGGTFVGDVYVEANGFTVGKSATVEGNIYFAKQEYKDSFVVVDTAKVTGSQEVK